jgi:hypothetical protein
MELITELLEQGYTIELSKDDDMVCIFANHPKRVRSFSVKGVTLQEAVNNLSVKVLGF